ncbi:hypothetical protein HDZ31DRAFT_64274 [Schizophyllum fasciatum]
MPKTASESKSKAATAKANAKPLKDGAGAGNVAREPTAYQKFMADNLKSYKERNTTLSHKEAFSAVAALWRDAPENPNRGKEIKPRAPKKRKAELDGDGSKATPAPAGDRKLKAKSTGDEKAKSKPKDDTKSKSDTKAKPKSKPKSKSKAKSAATVADEENLVSSDPADPMEPSSEV